jgi:bifunctional UDP-N-acetylglucosamine pyrophosphorylase/glucosamine-1-phosphate N-acetyltransferase
MAIAALILAAGKGTRMKSELVKVMHLLEGRPMVSYPVAVARALGAERVALVVGHQADKVREWSAGDALIAIVLQEEQLGTGHAVASAAGFLEECDGDVLILCGDVPLITEETLRALMMVHTEHGGAVTILTARVADPFGYGRVIKDATGRVLRIVEHKDATAAEREVNEINSGIYCVNATFLRDAITKIGNDNAQKEYYLTDIIGLATGQGHACHTFTVDDPAEVMGVNDRVQMATAGAMLRRRINEALMVSGVTIIDPAVTYIEPGTAIGRDTIIYPNTVIGGGTVIGEGCVIDQSVTITKCHLGDRVHIKAGSVLEECIIHNDSAVGPMAHLRPGTVLKERVKIGNFVETKKAVIEDGSKASHLTYLGDCFIGKDVNIGCGTITCNYDGKKKHITIIEDGVFVGSDVQFVAPVKVGKNSLIAAGTTVTIDIPPDSLALSRTPQVNKEGWVTKKQARDAGHEAL